MHVVPETSIHPNYTPMAITIIYPIVNTAATWLLTPVLMPALLPEDSDFTGVHSEHRPEYMHTLSFLIFHFNTMTFNNIMSCISENIYHFTSATACLRSGSPHNAMHFTRILLWQTCDFGGCLLYNSTCYVRMLNSRRTSYIHSL